MPIFARFFSVSMLAALFKFEFSASNFEAMEFSYSAVKFALSSLAVKIFSRLFLFKFVVCAGSNLNSWRFSQRRRNGRELTKRPYHH